MKDKLDLTLLHAALQQTRQMFTVCQFTLPPTIFSVTAGWTMVMKCMPTQGMSRGTYRGRTQPRYIVIA